MKRNEMKQEALYSLHLVGELILCPFHFLTSPHFPPNKDRKPFLKLGGYHR
jgi:hypothetical protein